MSTTTKRTSAIDIPTIEIKMQEIQEAMRTATDEEFWRLAEQWQKIAEQHAKETAFRRKPR